MNKKGFTLIEVLMVVLIVGILASLAMPRYTKVVEKAKMSEAKTVLSAIRTAEGIYFMEFDKYTATLADLDLDDNIHSGSLSLFEYTITMSGGEGSGDSGFKVEAKRKDGAYKGGTLTMSDNGSLVAGGIYKEKKMIREEGVE